MVEFTYQEMFPLKNNFTPYRLITTDHIDLKPFLNTEIVKIAPEGLTLLAGQAVGRSRQAVDAYIADLRASTELEMDLKTFRMHRLSPTMLFSNLSNQV